MSFAGEFFGTATTKAEFVNMPTGAKSLIGSYGTFFTITAETECPMLMASRL